MYLTENNGYYYHRMKSIFCIILTALSVIAFSIKAGAQTVSLIITNPSDMQRHEVVEADLQTICRLLGVDTHTPLVVKNAIGQEMVCQKSYDGKLLLAVSMQPNGKATYTVRAGQGGTFKSSVSGRVYHNRLDDLTWENDRGIYRMYGPALQRTGEKSYGTDVWVKNTPVLVAEERYRLHMLGWQQGDSLRKAGQKAEGDSVFMNHSFHLDHGYGMDCYAVGASLGCGAPALMKEGSLLFPYCYKECKILDNGPLHVTAELTYGTTAEGITEHRLVSLDKGSHFNRMTVWYDGIVETMSLASGVVLHSEDNVILGKDYVLYADPTDNPAVHQSQIYVGTVYPSGVDETIVYKGSKNHALGVVHTYRGEPYTYYFGSAWSNYDVPSMAHWRLVADEFLLSLKNKLSVSIERK